MTYRDLPIHQRITAKANALHFNYHYRITGGVLAKVSRKDADTYCPTIPVYCTQVKHNNYDLPTNYNPHA